jgi:Bacterial protein of unknown function (DUF899)
MTGHIIGTREEWLAARLKLLEPENELTRRSDSLVLGRLNSFVVLLRTEPQRTKISFGIRKIASVSRIDVNASRLLARLKWKVDNHERAACYSRISSNLQGTVGQDPLPR